MDYFKSYDVNFGNSFCFFVIEFLFDNRLAMIYLVVGVCEASLGDDR